MDGLRPETKDKVIRGLVGLPEDFKVGYYMDCGDMYKCVE